MLQENDLQELSIYLDALLAIVSDGSLHVHHFLCSTRAQHYEHRAIQCLEFRKANT
jgi:hypothetical protein